MKDRPGLLIFPFNGNALEAFDCIGDRYRFIGFVDDTAEKREIIYAGFPVYGREAFTEFPDASVLAVPGSPKSYRVRQQIIDSLGLPQGRFAQLIHPKATVSDQAMISFNVLIMAGVVITSNAVIGAHSCILPNTVIHHDVVVGESVLIGSNITIAGNTIIEDNCYIGSGSAIMNGLHIGRGTLIGLGSNVIRNVAANVCVVGNPARELTNNN